MRLCHLIEDTDPAAVVSRTADGQFDAADRIAYVDKGPRLPTGSVHGQWITDRRLNQKAVENRTVVAAVVEPVDEFRREPRFFGLGAPDDALMKISDSNPVVLVIIYPDSLGMRKALAKRVELDSFEGMIRPGFLLGDERSALIALARDGSVTHRLARRANALVLLDDGLSCEQVARVLLLDDDTIRRWHGAFAEGGRKALMRFEAGGSACVLSEAQRGKLVGWVRAASPRSTGQIGAWIASEFGVEYESRSGLVALLHRLGLEYRKPEVIPRHLDETKQRAFIKLYEKLMNALGADEAVLFVDAVHPTHGARAAGCWAAKDEHLAIEQTTGRQRLNIHGAIDLETGRTKMIEAEAIDAASTIKLLAGIEALYSTTALIHVFLDNARYHHAKIVRKWLSQPGRRIALHFVPSYCPHLNPIERLWALMHQHLTHNKTYPTCREFADAILNFLRDEVPRKWGEFCDSVTDNFRVVLPANFRILA